MAVRDNLKDRLSQLKGENSVRDEFLRKWSPSKGKSKATRFTSYPKRSQDESQDSSFSHIPQRSNYKAPQKSRGGGGHKGLKHRSGRRTATRATISKANHGISISPGEERITDKR